MLDPDSVKTATLCGFGMINVDFLLAGKYAASLTHQLVDIPGLIDVELEVFDYRFGNDKRRESAIWSWDEGDMGKAGPAHLKSNGRWGSISEETSMRFACAFGASNYLNPVDYGWGITDTHGTWACMAAGGVFWAPQSPLENEHLKAITRGEPVWINYTAVNNQLVLEPITSNVQSGDSPTQLVLDVHVGDKASAFNAVLQYTGGVGGAIIAQAAPHSPPLFKPYIHVDTRGKSIYLYATEGMYDSQGKINLPPGSYSITVNEQQNGVPAGPGYVIKVNVIPPR